MIGFSSLRRLSKAPGSLVLACTLACAAGLSCAGGTPDPDDPSGAARRLSHVPWKEKTRQQRLDWMGMSVFPKMKQTFTQFNADRFGDFSCQTCHGETMEMVDYHMPNTLYALSKTDTIEKARQYDAQVTDFMVNEVMPQMAKLLAEAPYDATTHTGFGCFGCHPSEK
jgi:hypothetical protein